MKNLGLLILRLASGGLMAGHGSQKLFGWFGGHGIEGTTGWLESIGMRPGRPWALMAGLSEFGGGALTLLGALNPFGPLGTIGAMGMATAKVHWGKPIWVTSGGAELPVTNIAIALALGLSGPGKYSVDRALGINLPRRLILVPGLLLAGASVAAGVVMSAQPQAQAQQQPQPQLQVDEERPEAVRVPDMSALDELERGEILAEQEPVRVFSTELQAEQSVDQPA
ncbi:MAG TPA: DoxX family protein [Chloroflexia bacterium]|nr:DoxX family protein [Chloroflexia bacterium]